MLQVRTPEMRFELYNLQSGALYHIEVVAFNDRGSSIPAPTLLVLTYDSLGKITRQNIPAANI